MNDNNEKNNYFSTPTSDKSNSLESEPVIDETKSSDEYIDVKSESYTAKKAYTRVIGYVEKQDKK